MGVANHAANTVIASVGTVVAMSAIPIFNSSGGHIITGVVESTNDQHGVITNLIKVVPTSNSPSWPPSPGGSSGGIVYDQLTGGVFGILQSGSGIPSVLRFSQARLMNLMQSIVVF